MKPIENPDNHALIARIICEWVYVTPPFASHHRWMWEEGEPIDIDYSGEELIFQFAHAREAAIDAARLMGFCLIMYSDVHYGYEVHIHIVGDAIMPVGVYERKPDAEFAALLWVAQQLQSQGE